MKKSVLKKYAKLLIRRGVNIQKGQTLIIYAGLDQPEFVQMVVEEAYKAKAKKVILKWYYQPLSKLSNKYQTVETLGTVSPDELAFYQWRTEEIPARLFIDSDDPDGSKGVNQQKASKANLMTYKVLKPYYEKVENKEQWCIAGVPGEKWAKKVFPELSKKKAMEKLWEAILHTSRVDDDPIAAWDKHNEDLQKRCAYLNSLGIKSLHYTSKNGTDFKVGLIDISQFCGGCEKTLQNIVMNPNIPSEECFTTPKKGLAEGIIHSSMPLSYRGELIEDFYFVFKEGKVVEAHAKKNESLLQEMINMDEGARYIGEVALVPYDSPIKETGILFYNTLYDENASCHIALGMGYSSTMKDYAKYTKENFDKMGVNDSIIHVDFMVGTKDLSIVAETKDNKKVQIFKNGTWAF